MRFARACHSRAPELNPFRSLVLALAACTPLPPSASVGTHRGPNDLRAMEQLRTRAALELACPATSLVIDELFVQDDAHPTLHVRGCEREAQYTCLVVQGIHWAGEHSYTTSQDTVCVREPTAAPLAP